MKILFLLAVPLSFTGCQRMTHDNYICGDFGESWNEVESIDPPHLNVEHKIKITHINQILVNNEPLNHDMLTDFLEAETKLRLLAYIYLDFDARTDCKIVKQVASTIEKSGICKKNICIIGHDVGTPPTYLEPQIDK